MPRSKVQICEGCHEREATAAAVLSYKGPNMTFTHLCQQCLEIEHAKGPKSLLDLLDQMEGKKTAPEWRLVFELSRHGPRQADRANAEKMWDAYKQGGWDMKVTEGRITTIFDNPSDGEEMFEIEDQTITTSWPV